MNLIPILARAGWQVSGAPARLPEGLRSRYAWAPSALIGALELNEIAVSPNDTVWLLTADTAQRKTGFRWNEWELISLETAGSDTTWGNQIITFWDSHFPFLLSVKSGYAYLAVERAPGFPVVYGREPQFEEPETIANSFESWLRRLEAVVAGQCAPGVFEAFL